MNCFLVFLLCLCVRVRSAGVIPNDQPRSKSLRSFERTDILASVREYPSLLHKCTATFINPDLLITTARCLYCEEECQLFVHALSDHLTDDEYNESGVLFNVTATAIHPGYERNPQKNDIGLIKLSGFANGAAVFGLPTDINDRGGVEVDVYTWQFTSNLQEYHLERKVEKTISNAMCSLVLNRYIGYRQICTRRDEPVTMGLFDQGSPLIADENGQGVILGIYVREGAVHGTKVHVYQAVFPFVNWIAEIVNCNFTCSLPRPAVIDTNQNILQPTPSGTPNVPPIDVTTYHPPQEASDEHVRSGISPDSNSKDLPGNITIIPTSSSSSSVSPTPVTSTASTPADVSEVSDHSTSPESNVKAPNPVSANTVSSVTELTRKEKEPTMVSSSEEGRRGNKDETHKSKAPKWTPDLPLAGVKKTLFLPKNIPL